MSLCFGQRGCENKCITKSWNTHLFLWQIKQLFQPPPTDSTYYCIINRFIFYLTPAKHKHLSFMTVLTYNKEHYVCVFFNYLNDRLVKNGIWWPLIMPMIRGRRLPSRRENVPAVDLIWLWTAAKHWAGTAASYHLLGQGEVWLLFPPDCLLSRYCVGWGFGKLWIQKVSLFVIFVKLYLLKLYWDFVS